MRLGGKAARLLAAGGIASCSCGIVVIADDAQAGIHFSILVYRLLGYNTLFTVDLSTVKDFVSYVASYSFF
jgi:hypothetical protein